METAQPSSPQTFRLDMPVVAFEKGDAPEGQRKRIAGIISTEGLDHDNERLIQQGLNFGPFLKNGHYLNEHSKGEVTDIVGYPAKVEQFAAGEMLPNGQTCPHACTWSEGFLIGKKGDEIYQLARDMQGTPRRLAFSVEGTVGQRDAQDRNKVLSATINHCAITAHPKNEQTGLELLLRSLTPRPVAVPRDLGDQASSAQSAAAAIAKTYTVGTPAAGSPSPRPTPNQPLSGEGMGQALMSQLGHLARRLSRRKARPERLKKRKKASLAGEAPRPAPTAKSCRKASISFTRESALDFLASAVPGITPATAQAVYLTALSIDRPGQ